MKAIDKSMLKKRITAISLIILAILILCIFFASCSSDVTKTYKVRPDSYLSPTYEDLHFENVSMDICYPILDFDIPPEGADTVHIMKMKEFDDAFKKYFPDGIKMYSSVKNTSWIFFKPNYNPDKETIEYYTKTKEGLDFYVYLDDSLSIFQRQSTSDFLMMFQMISIINNISDSTNQISKYATVIDLQYSIWDRNSGDLVAMDKVSSRVEFDKLVNNWPYRAAITKSAALIFEKLPMFEK